MCEWQYKNKPLLDTDIPDKAFGFVYLITNLETTRAYIGKKLLWFKKTSMKTVILKNGTKKKKKVSSLVPSDWKTYWSSSPNLIADIKLLGEDKFKREILFFCSSKGSMSYYEARAQFDNRVLENQDKWYNGISGCRIHHSHIKPILE